MSGGYIMLPGNMSPHVIAAMFNMETPIDGAEQGQMQAHVNVIIYQWVVLHHVVTK